MRHPKKDWVIIDRTNANWPGVLSYRSASSWKGYATLAAAESRVARVASHYAAANGAAGGPDLRIYMRKNGGVVR